MGYFFLDIPELIIGVGLIALLIGITLLISRICIAIHRMHDIGKSGAWIFIALIPVLGWAIFIIFACLDSQEGENEYGPNPKEIIE